MNELNKEYDVLIIGGGITGAGILRDCAMRGLKALLLEKGEFGGVTTMGSSRMIHGGLRYVWQDYKETKTCAFECGYICRIARPFLKKIVFLFPFFKGEKIKLEGADLIVFEAYDRLCKERFTNPHVRLSAKETLKLIPELKGDVIGAVTFEEWEVNPQEFTIANIKSAMLYGAEAQQHMEVIGFILKNGVIRGVAVLDEVTKKYAFIEARIIVNATGPWASKITQLAGIPDFELRPTKGIHLVLDIPLKYGVGFQAIDKRGLLAQPRDNKLLLGTTDDDYNGDLDDLKTTEEEEKYLLESLSRVLPEKAKAPIVERVVGVRPTIGQWGMPEDKVSRKFVVIDHKITDGLDGLITVCGGKMTIYRIMAEKTADMICQKFGVNKSCQTHLVELLDPMKIRPEEESDRKVRKYYETSFTLNKKTLPSNGFSEKIRTYGFLGTSAMAGLIRKLSGKSRRGLKYFE